jgi:hypothetical protein
MNSIYQIGKGQEMIDTGLGNEVMQTAIQSAINLAGQFISLTQKNGRRATIEACIYNDMFVVRVINNHIILTAYAVKNEVGKTY